VSFGAICIPMAMLLRLLTILAVVALPFGIVTPASAAHHETETMLMQHCPDQRQPAADQGIAQCTMACAAALPAFDAGLAGGPVIICAPEPPAPSHALHGIQHDIATPPPKPS